MVLFKRFYLSHSVLEFDPAVIALAALALAFKEVGGEGSPTPADLASTVESGCRKAAAALAARILAAEGTVMAGCRFDLRIAHPYRALADLMTDVEAVCDLRPGQRSYDALHKAARQQAAALLLTDAPLLAAPLTIALATLRDAWRRLAVSSGPRSCRELLREDFKEDITLPTLEALDAHMAAMHGEKTLKDAREVVDPFLSVDDSRVRDPLEEDAAELRRLRKQLEYSAIWGSRNTPSY